MAICYDKLLENTAEKKELKKIDGDLFTTIELFAGAGGLALGIEKAGFESLGLIEFDKDVIHWKQDRLQYVRMQDVRHFQMNGSSVGVSSLNINRLEMQFRSTWHMKLG